jgi:hypothetical protein
MNEIKVGEYYTNTYRIIKIDKIVKEYVYFTIVEYHGGLVLTDLLYIHGVDIIQKYFKHLPYYNSPLWKVLEGRQ